MIQFNLREHEYKNHPMDYRYGIIVQNGHYAGYPVTVVDNHREVEYGKYTRIPAVCLLHLSEKVRQYMHLKLYDEFLYQSFAFKEPTYRMYDYTKVELNENEIIETLKGVLYSLQPSLQRRSLVGSKSDRLEDDPNYYEGLFVLNNEEEYTILKCRTEYKFFKGNKEYYPNWQNEEGMLFHGQINFDVYKVAIEVDKLRGHIVVNTNQILDNDNEDVIEKYRDLQKQLKELLSSQTY